MNYRAVPIERFGGLDRRSDPTEAGLARATSMTNLTLDDRGQLSLRDGLVLGSSTTATSGSSMCYYENASAGAYIVVRAGGALTPVNLSGGANGATTATTPTGMVRHGTAAAQRLYIVDGTTTMRRLEGTAWTNVVIPIAATTIAVTPDNRLIVGLGSRVHWSSATDPETWGSTDFQDLTPGDGQDVVALTTWMDKTFMFKEEKFFVHTGFTKDLTGGVVMDYRLVDANVGASIRGAAVAGDNGVYFFNTYGVYVTSGEGATLVSSDLGEPHGLGSPPPPVYYRRRLYVPAGNGDLYVLDTDTGAWVKWDGTATGYLCVVPDWSVYAGVFARDAATSYLSKYTAGATTDGGTTGSNGSAIGWTYTTGQSDLGTPDRKVIREVDLWGYGSVTVKVGSDGVLDTGSVVAMGATPATKGYQRTARRGTYFHMELSGTGAVGLNRAVLRLRDQEAPK